MAARPGKPKTPDPDAPVLGILGGGQLGRMLAESALRQGLKPVVLAASAKVPAAIPGVELHVGPLDDPEALADLVDWVDHLTVENEFLDLGRVEAALSRRPEVRIRPGLDAIAVSQDKLAQKRLFVRLGIPTAPWEVVHPATLEADLRRVGARFGHRFVLKWSRFGYDGHGNHVVTSPEDLARPELARFCERGVAQGAELYAEAMIDFQAELAMVSTRDAAGAQVCFPLVISRQERGVCREVLGPATALGVAAEVAEQARSVLGSLGAHLDWCGTFAVEFFLDADGKLLANEMAPRVHNTGHYTLWHDEPSQFDLHVQAVTGRPLQAPAVRGLVAMRNLLGPWDVSRGLPCAPPRRAPPAGVDLYWYDKTTVSPGRKMGHLTGRAHAPEALEALLAAMRAYEAAVWDDLERSMDDGEGP